MGTRSLAKCSCSKGTSAKHTPNFLEHQLKIVHQHQRHVTDDVVKRGVSHGKRLCAAAAQVRRTLETLLRGGEFTGVAHFCRQTFVG